MAILKSDVSDLKSRMSNVETDVSEMKSQISDLQKNVTDMKLQVTDLQNDVTDIKVNKLENGAIRIMNDLHSCYVDTYERYRDGADKFDQAFSDIATIKGTVSKHFAQIQELQLKKLNTSSPNVSNLTLGLFYVLCLENDK